MDYLLVKTKGKRGCLYKLLTDKTIYQIPDLSHTHEYDDELKLRDDEDLQEWFNLEHFSEKGYFLPIMGENFTGVGMSSLPRGDYDNVAFTMSIQSDSRYFLFQKITSSLIYKRYSLLTLSEQPSIVNLNEVIVMKLTPDCIYDRNVDTLYFKNLNAITTIFNGINELYKEATNDEVDAFLNNETLVDVAPDFTTDKVKTANRRRIKEATQLYENFSEEQKRQLPNYIGKYCPNLFDEHTQKFKITSEEDLTILLNGLRQRYYTTEIDNRKQLANSVSSVE